MKKNVIDEFRQDKNSFLIYSFIFSTIWFLAVCILFGVYIYFSFDNNTITSTQIQGGYSQQGVANGSISIN